MGRARREVGWIGSVGAALSVVLAGCAMDVAASDEVRVTEQAVHKWGNYHWARMSNPFTLKLNDYVTSAWDAYLAQASADWSVSNVLDTTILAPSAEPAFKDRKRCTAISGQIKVCNARYGFNGWLGLAQISASGSHITQGTAKTNDSYYDTGAYSTASRQMVVCQEVAHCFGLGHQDEDHYNVNLGSCMDYSRQPEGGIGPGEDGADFDYGPANTAPNAHDYEELAIIYGDPGDPTTYPGHVDGTTTIKQGAGQGGAAPGTHIDTGNGPENVGEPVGFDAQGRADTFTRHTGPDSVVITHVYWAD